MLKVAPSATHDGRTGLRGASLLPAWNRLRLRPVGSDPSEGFFGVLFPIEEPEPDAVEPTGNCGLRLTSEELDTLS